MGRPASFDLNTALDRWVQTNCSTEEMTHSDILEFREHIYFTVKELSEENGLTEEEAFAVAKVRFGTEEDWGDEMKKANEKNLQLKKVVLIFSGVLIYFIIYHIIFCLSEAYYLWLNYYNNDLPLHNISRVNNMVITIYFIIVLCIVFIFFMHGFVVKVFSRINISTRKVIGAFIFLTILFFLKRYLLIEVKHHLETMDNIRYFQSIFRKFKYVYPAIMCSGFLLLFLRYKKNFYHN